jgi:hypothetical protein
MRQGRLSITKSPWFDFFTAFTRSTGAACRRLLGCGGKVEGVEKVEAVEESKRSERAPGGDPFFTAVLFGFLFHGIRRPGAAPNAGAPASRTWFIQDSPVRASRSAIRAAECRHRRVIREGEAPAEPPLRPCRMKTAPMGQIPDRPFSFPTGRSVRLDAHWRLSRSFALPGNAISFTASHFTLWFLVN